ncbi:hypothetical protein GCM10007082_06070 [Oceanisphaera arctica]|nr:hypothetical protein GCM10007082_06070 [Oceanisphaera arctica]
MVGGADPFILPDAPVSTVSAACERLGVAEEATEITAHDRDMPGMACPSLQGCTRSESWGAAVLPLVLGYNT